MLPPVERPRQGVRARHEFEPTRWGSDAVGNLARHGWLIAIAILFAPAVGAQTLDRARPTRLELSEDADERRITIRFDVRVRPLRHAPQERGSELRIDVDVIEDVLSDVAPGPRLGDVLKPPAGSGVPLRLVRWERLAPGRGQLIVELERSLDFVVEPGADARSIVVRLPSVPTAESATATATDDAVPATPPGPPDGRALDDRLVAEARRAITDGELERATALLRKAEDEAASEAAAAAAKELLGLVLERRGQRAQAAGEYEEILERWPDGDVAARVRQRLDALLAADAPAREPLEPVVARDEATGGYELEGYGMLGATYSRFETITSDAGARVLDSSVIGDLAAFGRLETSRFVLGGELLGSYRYDTESSARADDSRISTLLVRASDPEGSIDATLGRQSRRRGGVLGRFDGLHASARVLERVRVAGLVGFTRGTTSAIEFATDEIVFGASVEGTDLPYGLEGELFVVSQRDQGRTDRVAIGGELRYAEPGRFGLLFLDYDVYFQSLNTFLLTGNVTFGGRTDVNLLFETRNAPVLTLGNALIGQPADDLDDLSQIFTDAEIEQLARDRTARSYTGTVGVTRRQTDRLQVFGDVTLSSLGSTPESGGVLATPAFGPEVSTGVQALLNDLLVRADFASLGVRYFAGETIDRTSLFGSYRVPVTRRLRADLRLRTDFRTGTQDTVIVRPMLRLDYRRWGAQIEGLFGLEWLEAMDGTADVSELSYLAELVVRWEF